MLRLKGFQIVTQRFACPRGEIDIIAQRGALVIFVEVKARRDEAAAAEAITLRQRRRVSEAAQVFLQQRPEFAGCALRFDAIIMGRRMWPCHIADAWRPEG